MSRHEICPSCGTKLGASQTRGATRTCSSCQRSNPSGFNYCGFCASPMEDTQMRARMSELAAPPGGWPSLTSELVEVRFYLQQGLLDDAYELLSIMQKRHPGHPQLDELTHRPKPARRVDTDTIALVDSVLAESANLVGRVPRRAAPRWKAPPAPASPRAAAPASTSESRSDAAPSRSARTGKTGASSTARAARGTGSQREAPPTTTRAATGPQRATSKPTAVQRTAPRPGGTVAQPRTGARAEAREIAPAPTREHTRIYRTVEPPRTVIEARAAELARVEAARARRPEAAPVDDRDRAARAKATRAAERAEAARVAEEAATERARARAAELARAAEPAPARGSSTVVVDVLQPAAPWSGSEGEALARAKPARKRRDAAAPTPAEAPLAAASTETASEPKETRKRRASFGEHVLNRLR